MIRHMHEPPVERRRGRMDTPCGNCGQTGHSSGPAKCPAKGTNCHLCQRPNHWKVMCQMKKQSQMVTESASSGQTNRIMPPWTAKSSLPFLQTVQIITRAGRLAPFCAEVHTVSCTIIDCEYLGKFLPDKPVTTLRELPRTYKLECRMLPCGSREEPLY